MNEVKTRYFNKIEYVDDIVIKYSKNKEKLQKEYNNYYLLPDEFKNWFVQPYDYMETKEFAQYKMKKVMSDNVANLWIDGISVEKFEKILDAICNFLYSSPRRNCTEKEYKNDIHKMFFEKVSNRINEFKKMKEYKRIPIEYQILLDEIWLEYKKQYEEIINISNCDYFQIIPHGDLCFSNIFFDFKNSDIKLIDVKGANNLSELWTTPYYDLAKLSHSICGMYEYIIYDKVTIDEKKERIYFDKNNQKYVNLFKNRIQKMGYNFLWVKLFECSLFISMIPLHIENIKNIKCFIINAKMILEKIKEEKEIYV